MSESRDVTLTLSAHALLIAAACAAATCEEVLNGNAEVPGAVRRKSAETFARTADAIITAVLESTTRDAHVAANGTWNGPHDERPWRQAAESERGDSLAVLAQNSPRAIALIRELREADHGR